MNISNSYKQLESFSFNDMPEEIILKITHYCEVKELGRMTSVSEKISRIASDNNLWKSRYYYDAVFHGTQKNDNYKQLYCDNLNKDNILVLKAYGNKTRKVIYKENTLIIDLKAFIFNKYCLIYKGTYDVNQVQMDESQVRVIYPRGINPSDTKKISECNIPTQTTLFIQMKGFPIFIK